jgi:hypothetical protein
VSDVFSNPVGWVDPMVRSWPRFWLWASVLTALLCSSFYAAAPNRWPGSLAYALFPGAMQLLLLYVSRRLYLLITSPAEQRGSA